MIPDVRAEFWKLIERYVGCRQYRINGPEPELEAAKKAIDDMFDLAVPAMASKIESFKLSADGEVAVSTVVRLSKDMTACPRGAKVQLLGAGGVLSYGVYDGDPFWIEWAPLPKRAL